MGSFKNYAEVNGIKNLPAGTILLSRSEYDTLLIAIGVLEEDDKKTVIMKIRDVIATLKDSNTNLPLLMQLSKCSDDELSGDHLLTEGDEESYAFDFRKRTDSLIDPPLDPEMVRKVEVDNYADKLQKDLNWLLGK